VGYFATIAAKNLGLPPARVHALRLAGVLHDIGKYDIPDSILDKPGPLTRVEWLAIRRHPEIGHQIITEAGLDLIAGWVLAHHERPDGTGYPFRLRADQIPLEASILAVADAYHAMRVERAYQAPIGHEAAAAELRACAGTQFDPEVVEALIDAIETIAIHGTLELRPAAFA
jgi:HD-GYP domain-containing protein (c-di-GMP phosphodiesterase class II)